MIKLGIAGIAGRMGRRIAALAIKDGGFQLAVGLESKGHPDLGHSIEGVMITDRVEDIQECDCLIDFTSPQATLEHLEYAVRFKKSMVIGTTGITDQQQTQIKEAAQKIPIVFSPNMSVGVNLLFMLVEMTSKVLRGYKVSIIEAHHIHKKDAPSGTAKKIAEIVNRHGGPVKAEDIQAIREGEIVGDHRIIFESDVDRMELFHSAKTRDIFVVGALKAAHWLKTRGPSKGLVSMDEVIFG